MLSLRSCKIYIKNNMINPLGHIYNSIITFCILDDSFNEDFIVSLNSGLQVPQKALTKKRICQSPKKAVLFLVTICYRLS